jgi:pentapeptide MXKDX repeat protein
MLIASTSTRAKRSQLSRIAGTATLVGFSSDHTRGPTLKVVPCDLDRVSIKMGRGSVMVLKRPEIALGSADLRTAAKTVSEFQGKYLGCFNGVSGTTILRWTLYRCYLTKWRTPMKKILVATALTLMCGSAFAQTNTGPAPQSDNVQKPGMNNMEKGSMEKGTTGMNNNRKDGMKKDGMTQGGASKDGQGQMNKGGMSK